MTGVETLPNPWISIALLTALRKALTQASAADRRPRIRLRIHRGRRGCRRDCVGVARSLSARLLRGSTKGFSGTLPKRDMRAAGLITLDGNESGDRVRIPMLPESWDGP